jgi:hypothetical protein
MATDMTNLKISSTSPMFWWCNSKDKIIFIPQKVLPEKDTLNYVTTKYFVS